MFSKLADAVKPTRATSKSVNNIEANVTGNEEQYRPAFISIRCFRVRIKRENAIKTEFRPEVTARFVEYLLGNIQFAKISSIRIACENIYLNKYEISITKSELKFPRLVIIIQYGRRKPVINTQYLAW